jgi:putative transposase
MVTPEGKEFCIDQQLLSSIRKIKNDPEKNYGYRKMTYALRLKGYVINRKKVYRLMKQADWLKNKAKPKGRTFATYRIVTPEGPLEVLEMDIKQVWVTEHRRHAYILTVIDTFTRAVLHWSVGYQMKRQQVKRAFEQVIMEYLQPYDQLSKGVHVELRNDNGPQFAARMIQEFFRENYINQVFTHPYTPQENGHVESFHNILSKRLSRQVFWSLAELENCLERFYRHYNEERLHGSIAYLWPMKFWDLWEEGKIIRIVKTNKKVIFKLAIPYYQVSGNESQREVSCLNLSPLDEDEDLNLNEVNGPESLLTTSV